MRLKQMLNYHRMAAIAWALKGTLGVKNRDTDRYAVMWEEALAIRAQQPAIQNAAGLDQIVILFRRLRVSHARQPSAERVRVLAWELLPYAGTCHPCAHRGSGLGVLSPCKHRLL